VHIEKYQTSHILYHIILTCQGRVCDSKTVSAQTLQSMKCSYYYLRNFIQFRFNFRSILFSLSSSCSQSS